MNVLRSLSLVLLLPVAAGCGDDETDPQAAKVQAACGKIADAACAKYVECRVTVGSTTFTSEVCTTGRSRAIANCQTEEGAALAAANDADIDQCAAELSQVACANICNRVPDDPPTCHKISPEPNVSTITCAP